MPRSGVDNGALHNPLPTPLMPSRFFRPASLRLVLTVPYVVLVIGLALAIGILSYDTGRRAVATISEQLLLEVVGRIAQAIDRHVVGSGAVLETAFPSGVPAPPDIQRDFHDLRNRLWIATSIHTDPNNYVYYGNEAGQGMGLLRQSAEQVELRLKLSADEKRVIYRIDGVDGPLQFVRREASLFDPRSRPWYLNGRSAPGHTWTAVYIDFGSLQLVATRARRVLGADGAFAGVVATDLALKALNDFVGRLNVSPNGVAFIIEPDGNLIASSASENVITLPDGRHERITARESTHPLVRAAYETAHAHIARHGSERLPHMAEFDDADGNLIYAAFDRVRDDAGLDWITIVAMPARDYLGGVIGNVRRTILLAALAVCVAVITGLAVLGWFARDLRRLSAAAGRIGDGDLDTPVGIDRGDEIGELSRNFERMQVRLRTDRLTGLANREAFVQQLQRRIERSRNDRRAPHFGVLFIDLNRFKEINDSFGHAVGDEVLRQVGARLRTNVRKEDLVARYAGDEFVILIDAVADRSALDKIRLHIETTLRAPTNVGAEADNPIMLAGGAIGGALFPDDGDSSESLVRSADHAMYERKLQRPGEGARFPQQP